MEWEEEVWDLYEQCVTQWRHGFNGRTGLDYGPVFTLMREKCWDIEFGLEMLQAIEHAVIEASRPKEN